MDGLKLTGPLQKNGSSNYKNGLLPHNDIIGKPLSSFYIRGPKGIYKIDAPTLDDYVSLTPRLVTPVCYYPCCISMPNAHAPGLRKLCLFHRVTPRHSPHSLDRVMERPQGLSRTVCQPRYHVWCLSAPERCPVSGTSTVTSMGGFQYVHHFVGCVWILLTTI